MHTLSVVAATAPSGWLLSLGSVLLGGAVVPFLLSVIPDAVALLVQRRRWQVLAVVIAANAAALGGLNRMLALAMATDNGYLVNWPELIQLLFVVGLVVALWHGLPRTMRAVLRRRREDRERVPLAEPESAAGNVVQGAPASVLGLEPLPA
jgi:MFS family permease